MTTAWLFLVLCLAAVATFAAWSRRTTHYRLAAVLAFLLAAPVAFLLMQVPLGHPTTDRPPAGEHVVIGARIDVPTANSDGAIYVLLDTADEPRYYRMPYSTSDANNLQEAIDGAQQGEGGVGLRIGEGGESVFHPPPVRADEVKVPEIPTIGGM